MPINDVVKDAVDFLKMHKYGRIIPNDDQEYVSFVIGTGDGKWEESYASANNWVFRKNSLCCGRPRPDASFCSDCGAGVNGRAVYERSDKSRRGGDGGTFTGEEASLADTLFGSVLQPQNIPISPKEKTIEGEQK